MSASGEERHLTERGAPWSRPRWVCPHDPAGNDRDTATYCPLAVSQSTRWGTTDE